MWQCELGVAQHSDIYQKAGDFFFFKYMQLLWNTTKTK